MGQQLPPGGDLIEAGLADLARGIEWVPEGWEELSPFIACHGRLDVHHFDLYAQALAKADDIFGLSLSPGS